VKRPKKGNAGLVVVDTSVWVAYFRGTDPVIERNLDELIDTDLVAIVPPVRLELILGCKKSQRASLMNRIDALHRLLITESTWNLAEDLAMRQRESGVTLGMVDVLIAAAASEHQASLWSLDKDFAPLFKAQLVRAFLPD
jgi:predicted nucleic acid-binding protein